MKKNFIPAILFSVALAVGSCSEDIPNSGSSDATSNTELVTINVSSGTTRGVDTATSTLETSDGVKLHIVDYDGSTKGAYHFEATDSDWSQSSSTALTWADISFPAYFYSLHDGTPQELGLDNYDSGSSKLSYQVTGGSAYHKDLVYHASTLYSIPTGSTINVFHKHALSKIHLYAATGGNLVYIAKVDFVNVYDDGTVTISPVSASELTTDSGITWEYDTYSTQSYEYYWTEDNGSPATITSTSDGSTIINGEDYAPFMIIPQTTVGATAEDIADEGTKVTGSYINVIYYMTDSDGNRIVGYSKVSELPDADDYSSGDQEKTLYVMGAFPISYTFAVNTEYNIVLGLGSDGSSGGILLADYYVDKDGVAVSLTKLDSDDDGKDEKIDELDIPEIDTGDNILGDSTDAIDITVSAHDWNDEDEDSDSDADTDADSSDV